MLGEQREESKELWVEGYKTVDFTDKVMIILYHHAEASQ